MARLVPTGCTHLKSACYVRHIKGNCSTHPSSKRGKSPGTQVQHTLEIGTKDTEFRHFLASNCGTVWAITKSARTFAPITNRGNWGKSPGTQVQHTLSIGTK